MLDLDRLEPDAAGSSCVACPRKDVGMLWCKIRAMISASDLYNYRQYPTKACADRFCDMAVCGAVSPFVTMFWECGNLY